jgi:acyl carrier protein
MCISDEIAGILRQVAEGYGGQVSEIGPNATLEGDLRFDSVDLAAVQAALTRRFGPSVDLPAHVAGLSVDGIIGLTVADVVEYVRATAAA